MVRKPAYRELEQRVKELRDDTVARRNLNQLFLRSILFALLLVFLAVSISDAKSKSVLVLNSYHQGYKWTDYIVEGIEKTLNDKIENLELHIEYMDTKRVYSSEYFQKYFEMLQSKYGKETPDAIIASDDNAFQFLLQYHDKLFRDTPVVFFGVNRFEQSMIEDNEHFTGVVQQPDIEPTIDLALKLHPGTRRIVILSDATPTGQAHQRGVMKAAKNYKDLEFIYFDGKELTHAELYSRLSKIPDNSIVLMTLWLKDRIGNFLPWSQGMPEISARSPVPVYGLVEVPLAYGLLGGKIQSGYYQGKKAAEITIRILVGHERPANIPVERHSPNKYMFNYKQLQRWGIPESKLPPDSIILERPVSYYQKYKYHFWGAFSTFVLMFLSIIILTVNTRKRRHAEKALQKAHDELEEKIKHRTQALMNAKEKLAFSHRLLQIANRNIAMKSVLEEFIVEIKNFTRCEAIGIRILDEEGNIPYKAYEGFSKRFYEKESPLSIKSDQCMCINVVKGNPDPKLPFYTEYGSFYMNGTTRFLATVSEEDKGQNRNVCNQVGYESVALIPIKMGDLILGLIHIADPRENMVPIETVKVMEEAAMYHGTAIQRISAEEMLRHHTHSLGERVKELNCLYSISGLVEMPDTSLKEIFQGTIDLIPPSWQYPEITCARLILEDQEFKTKNFKETIWSLTSDILVHGKPLGVFEVGYLEDKPEIDEGPFLKEARNLINAITERLGHIIELKQAEEALQDVQEEMLRKEKLAIIGNLSGSIAHEIRNPLAVIDSSSYYLKKKLKEADAKTHEHLDRIKSQVDTATTIIESLFNLTRMEEPKLERLDLIAFTSELIDTAKVPKTINIIKNFSEDTVLVNTDQGQLSLVYNNIITNAVEAMDDEGTLTVTICKTSDDRVELSFSDTGTGIESKNLDRVLQPLFSTKTKGIGFGLSIASMVIEKHGGTIEVKSALAKGTTITAYLPLHDGIGKEE